MAIETNMNIPIITVTGKSGSGKTTLIVKLITELKQRGYRVGTIKHHFHSGFEIDQSGKDSWRYAQAGSVHVAISAPDKVASYRRLDHELTLDEVASDFNDVDIILTEGYRQAGKPALEIIRSETGLVFIGDPAQRFAFASDVPIEVEVPLFGLDDAAGIVNLIEELFLLQHTPDKDESEDDLIP
jgi:molybdopterin-guanine dinucleotide biosynthesis protein B